MAPTIRGRPTGPGSEGAEPEDGFGTVKPPAGTGDAETVGDQTAACSFHHMRNPAGAVP
ncbi:hypothetical protein [Streptomyces sp. NPDC003077]|uniref:hypothetical protein n=1 Tax=Streptomyces sp. NPDC003077 TaxID=3154443 RepID=UPI0033B9295D